MKKSLEEIPSMLLDLGDNGCAFLMEQEMDVINDKTANPLDWSANPEDEDQISSSNVPLQS